MKTSYFSCVLVISAVQVAAQTSSLYIPGFDPQPLSADILGVDSQGRTTYGIHRGSATGTDDDFGLLEGQTVTLVEGSDYASIAIEAEETTVAFEFVISDGVAYATATDSTGAVVTESEVVSPIPVQLGTTATGIVTNAPASTTDASKTATQSSQSTTTPNSADIRYTFPVYLATAAVAFISTL